MCCCSANACELRKLYQRVQQISTMWSHRNKQHVTMMVVLLRKILFIAVFIVFLPSGIKASVVTGASCQQVYIRRPRIGQRCVTSNEVYKNHTAAPQERCMWHCLRDISCKVVNYNMDQSFCFQEPCVTLEPESDIVTMPMTMQEPCMTWVRQNVFPPPLDDISNFVTYPVLPDGGNDPDNKILVARAIIDSAKVPGKVHIPVNLGHFILNGQVLDFSAGNYEMLTVSPGCDVSWMNYDPDSGNSFPDGAVIGGYQNGHQLYVARKGDRHRGVPYRYAAGYYDLIGMGGAVGYGPHVLTFTEMEILVVHGWMGKRIQVTNNELSDWSFIIPSSMCASSIT